MASGRRLRRRHPRRRRGRRLRGHGDAVLPGPRLSGRPSWPTRTVSRRPGWTLEDGDRHSGELTRRRRHHRSAPVDARATELDETGSGRVPRDGTPCSPPLNRGRSSTSSVSRDDRRARSARAAASTCWREHVRGDRPGRGPDKFLGTAPAPAVADPAGRHELLWETCDTRSDRSAPTAATSLGPAAYPTGPATAGSSILDARTGEPVVDYRGTRGRRTYIGVTGGLGGRQHRAGHGVVRTERHVRVGSTARSGRRRRQTAG